MTIYFWKINSTHGYLSQWKPSIFEDEDGNEFPTAEHYMMYQKAILFKDDVIADLILTEKSPAKVKKLGREVENFDVGVWNSKSLEIVKCGNYLKFSQNKDLCDLLLSTGEEELVEASPYDKIWGIGISPEDAKNGKQWNGKNLLGIALMDIRNKIR